MRLYYFLDEVEIGGHCSHWDAFHRLQQDGFLKDFKVCSFRALEKKLSWSEILSNAKKEILSFSPDIVVLSHTGKRYFPKSFFNDIRTKVTNIRFIYDERDVHGLLTKRIPLQTLTAARNCDVVYLVAEGFYASLYKRAGCQDVRYLPQATDDVRFGKDYNKKPGEDFDVVMIGNFVKGRFLSMPGVKFRANLANALSKRYGKRFGLFGNGWNFNNSWQGKCSYEEQEVIIQRSFCSIGADHFPNYLTYFSDRLPISLFAGRPHLRYETAGIRKYLSEIPSLYFYSHIDEAIQLIDKVITKPDEYINSQTILTTKEFIRENMLEIGRQKTMLLS